jgi:hypothetical protein
MCLYKRERKLERREGVEEKEREREEGEERRERKRRVIKIKVPGFHVGFPEWETEN